MRHIRTYEDFINTVEALGFMAFSDIIPGWTSLNQQTLMEQWHTGDPETDPWQWKDRVAQEKRLAFGCLLNGHKGFITKKWFPVFYKAYHPEESFEERWENGQIKQTVYKVYGLFSEGSSLSTDEIRRAMGVTKKQGAGAIDTALKLLQQEYYITVSGNRRKVNAQGEPYGWPSNTYERIEDWAGADWLSTELTREAARQRILETVLGQCQNPDIRKVTRVLGLA
jgi:hypothetical protein